MSFIRKAAKVYFGIAGVTASTLTATHFATYSDTDPLNSLFEKKYIPMYCTLAGALWPKVVYEMLTEDYPFDVFRHLPSNPVQRDMLLDSWYTIRINEIMTIKKK